MGTRTLADPATPTPLVLGMHGSATAVELV